MDSDNYSFETKCVRSGYSPKSGESVVPPIIPSVTYKYDTTEQVHELFDLKKEGYFYSRIENPTVSVVEKRLADLEGGVGALLTSSGQSANFFALINLASTGDHFICAKSSYGGTINLLQHRMKTFGFDVSFVDNDASKEEIINLIRPNTKAILVETLSNPTLRVVDIEMWADAAHQNFIPLIVDNTFATPYFCKPFEFGADIVTHSATKYLDGHALEVSGVIIDSGNFDWVKSYQNTGRFGELVNEDITYKNISYVNTFKRNAYIVKARVQLMRDLGATPSPFSAFLLGNGLQTLPLRMKTHYSNALKVANYLNAHSKVEFVNFPGLVGDKYYNLKQKYLKEGCSGVLSFEINSADAHSKRINAAKFINALNLVNIEVNVAEIRSCALHPASSTHRQMSDDELLGAGITPGLIRLSVGLENVDDIIKDLDNALSQI